MGRIRQNQLVRVRSGRAVDSDRCRGGDLQGLQARVLSRPAVYAGPDGVKKEERVAVAFCDQGEAPVGIVDIPTSRLESTSRIERCRSAIAGFGGGLMRKLGIVRERYVTRDGKRVKETTFKDGTVETAAQS